MEPNPTSFLSRATDWLFQQGVSTVLLCLICYAAYRGAPRVEALFERQQTAHREERQQDKTDFLNSLKSQGDLFERTLDRVNPRGNANTELPFERPPDPTPAGSPPSLESPRGGSAG